MPETLYRSFRANILSTNASFTQSHLDRLLVRKVEVYCPAVKRVVGYADDFEIVGCDLWATLVVDVDCPEQARATAIVGMHDDRSPLLINVLYSSLTREQLVALTQREMQHRGWRVDSAPSPSAGDVLHWRSKRRATDKPN